jgi:hypothetical protein
MKLLALLCALALTGCDYKSELSNKTLMYGDTGLPKNCRAIIKANIDGWREGEYGAEEVLGSIDRNCGQFGHSWEQ